MPRRVADLSIRARLTLFFVLSIAAVLLFTALALVALVHRSLVNGATNRVSDALAQVETRLATAPLPSTGVLTLPTTNDVVVQVTDATGRHVWAASTALGGTPPLARAVPDNAAVSGLDAVLVASPATASLRSQLSQGAVESITTSRGSALAFGFVYGTAITHSVTVLLASVAVSFPLLLVIAGTLIWFGIGLALAPVESIRRRVERIAARDLTERVPVTGGDDEIARLSRTVNEMLDRLESSSRFQQEFVSNASHELRSPLTTLLATVERARTDPSAADVPAVLDRVEREGRRLDALIEDLFWLARNDEHRIEFRRVDVDLDDLLYEEANRIRAITELTVDTSEVTPTRVVGDPATLRRMVRNVVDNAARYARRELRFSARYEDDEAVMRIADDGEGIDVTTAARYFQRFVRSDPARARTSGGTGLGLAIVADIAARHGGRARFVPVPAGSCLELRVRRDGAGRLESAR